MKMLKKVLLMLVGLMVMAVAMAFLSAAGLGISPVQSLSYVISCKFPSFITFGTASAIWNLVLVAVQILLLRKEFRLWELLQIPLTLYFAVVIDLAKAVIALSPAGMTGRVAVMLCGVVILAFGIFLTVEGDLVMNSGEAAVKAIAYKTKKNFGTIKVFFDSGIVLMAIIASFVFFGEFRWDMVGIGTLCCAFLTGFVIKGFSKLKGWIVK